MNTVPFVLSGGGARGFAHIGVLKALEEADIYPSEIVATSAGALLGVFIADGYKPDQVKQLILDNISIGYLFDFKSFFTGPGLISLNKLGEFIRANLKHQLLEELPIPFYPTATNYTDGSQVIFKTGSIIPAIIAASSIPAVFPPVMIDGIPFVDGGLYNNMPIEPFAHRKNEVIAVNVNPIAPYNPYSSLAETIDRAVVLSFTRNLMTDAAGCKMYIEPAGLHQFGIFDVGKLEEIYEAGYQYTKEMLK
jgi:NTE family protein